MIIGEFEFEEYTDLTKEEITGFKAWYKKSVEENKRMFEEVETFQVYPDGDYMSFTLHLKDGKFKDLNNISVPKFLGGDAADGGSIGIDIATGKIIGWEKITKEVIFKELFGNKEEDDACNFYTDQIDEYLTILEKEEERKTSEETPDTHEVGSVDDFC